MFHLHKFLNCHENILFFQLLSSHLDHKYNVKLLPIKVNLPIYIEQIQSEYFICSIYFVKIIFCLNIDKFNPIIFVYGPEGFVILNNLSGMFFCKNFKLKLI